MSSTRIQCMETGAPVWGFNHRKSLQVLGFVLSEKISEASQMRTPLPVGENANESTK